MRCIIIFVSALGLISAEAGEAFAIYNARRNVSDRIMAMFCLSTDDCLVTYVAAAKERSTRARQTIMKMMQDHREEENTDRDPRSSRKVSDAVLIPTFQLLLALNVICIPT